MVDVGSRLRGTAARTPAALSHVWTQFRGCPPPSVLDGDPTGAGNPSDAAVGGKLVLDPDSSTLMDDQGTDYAGMGGQGVLALPIVYNGWSQHIPTVAPWNAVTCRQRNPITWKKAC